MYFLLVAAIFLIPARSSHPPAVPSSIQRMLQRHIAAEAAACAGCSASNPVKEFLERAAVEARRPHHHNGMPKHSAMPARLRDRTAWFGGALPTLQFSCQMCEAEFPNRLRFEEHVDKVHGTHRWYQCALMNRLSIQPYVVSPTEKRKVIKRFATSQQFATIDPENEAYQPRLPRETQHQMLWAAVFKQCAQHGFEQGRGAATAGAKSATLAELSAVQRYEATFLTPPATAQPSQQARAFQACVFCAMLHWSETLCREYLAGPKCSLPTLGR